MLAPGKNYVGTVVRVPVNFETDADVDVDPATVGFSFRSPCGAITTYAYGTDAQIVRTSAGDYYVEITPDRAGRWFWRWLTSGAATTVALEGDFLVQHSRFVCDDGPWSPFYYW